MELRGPFVDQEISSFSVVLECHQLELGDFLIVGSYHSVHLLLGLCEAVHVNFFSLHI
jgi:hypothetical protein